MATPANWDQFNEDMRRWQELAQEMALKYEGLVNVADGGTLGALAFVADLAKAPVGDLPTLQKRIGVEGVAGRTVVGGSGALMARGFAGLGGPPTYLYPEDNLDNVTETGFYGWAAGPQNSPFHTAAMIVHNRNSIVWQRVIGIDLIESRRVLQNGVWSPFKSEISRGSNSFGNYETNIAGSIDMWGVVPLTLASSNRLEYNGPLPAPFNFNLENAVPFAESDQNTGGWSDISQRYRGVAQARINGNGTLNVTMYKFDFSNWPAGLTGKAFYRVKALTN